MSSPQANHTPVSPHIPQRISARLATLGEGLTLYRTLPTRQRRMIGAWCFLDHVGPVPADPGMHVGQHPHTGLQTFTWMIEGEILHRDSLGNEQVIRPGQVNLMTAGHGITHTEDSLSGQTAVHAAQLWIALPPAQADMAPAFEHHPQLPQWEDTGARFTLLAGQHAGRNAPPKVYSPLMGLDIACTDTATLQLPLNPGFEHGLMPLRGELQIGQDTFTANELAYLPPGLTELPLTLAPDTQLLVLGGEPFPVPLLMWWNFVGFSKADLSQAQADWASGAARFGAMTAGKTASG